MLYRMWATIGLLNESKINCTLVKEDRNRDKACNGIDISVSVLVELTDVETRLNTTLRSTERIQRRGGRRPKALTYQQAPYAED
jgi:hypothetical protein